MHNNKKAINKIIIATIAFIVMLLSIYPVFASDDEVAESIQEYDEDIYTIESIIYNKVPLFDINVFSDKTNGNKIKEDSIEGILRNIVAKWYATLMTFTYIILAVLIIFYGIRMAISTVAGEKARYKQMLYGWIKGLVIAATIHYVIYIVIVLNERVVNIIETSDASKEQSIYNTIKTRATDMRLGIGIPATIIFLTLLVMWTRFIWTYLKRTFTVILYIILAPLVIIKYTYELSYGKRSNALSNWFQRFATSVFIQSIHALFYSVFVRTSLEIATVDIHGFVIALMILNFMLSADKIFTSIFKFQFDGTDIDDLDRPFIPAQELDEMYITLGAARAIAPAISRTASRIVTNARYDAEMLKKIGINGKNAEFEPEDYIERNNREKTRRKIKNTNVNNNQNSPIRKIINGGINYYNGTQFAKDRRQMKILKKMSKKRGTIGIASRQTLALKKAEKNRKFSSNVKFIKDVTLAGAETIFAIPIGVTYGVNAGLTTFTNATNNIENAKKLGAAKTRESYVKYNKSLDDIVESVETVYNETENIEDEMENLTQEEKNDIKQRIKKYEKLNMNKYEIKKKVIESINTSSIKNEKELTKIIETIEEDLPENISEDDKEKIKNEAIKNIVETKNSNNTKKENNTNNTTKGSNNTREERNNSNRRNSTQNSRSAKSDYNYAGSTNNNNNNSSNNTNNYNYSNEKESNTREEYSIEEITNGINKAVIKYSFGEKYEKIGESVEKISSTNSKEKQKKDSKGKGYGELLDMNHFADTL